MKTFENKEQQDAFNEWSEKLSNLNKTVEQVQRLLDNTETNLKSSDNSIFQINYRIGKIEALKNYINSKN
jgi:hypothetical protein